MSYKRQLANLEVLDPVLDMRGGLAQNEVALPLPSPITNRFIDSSLVEVPGRIKTLVIVVDTAITSAGAQQATVQLYAARTIFGVVGPPGPPTTPFNAAQGAASQFPTTGPNACQAIGVPVALGPSAATFGGGGAVFFFSATWPGNPSASPPTSMTELVQEYMVLGIEITAPATFTAGVARAFFIVAPL